MDRRTRPATPLLLALILVCGGGRLTAQSSYGSDRLDLLEKVFVAKCYRCHASSREVDPEKENDFDFIDDLPRLARDRELVVPGDLAESGLWGWVNDPDDPMPPKDAEEKPLTEEEGTLLRDWILAGAPVTNTAAGTAVLSPPNGSEGTAPGRGAPGRKLPLSKLFGRFHPVVIHFPIALLIAAVMAEVFAMMTRRRDWGSCTVRFALWLGTLGALASVATGWVLAGQKATLPDEIDRHRWAGVAVLVVAAAVTALNEKRASSPGPKLHAAVRIGLLVLAVLAAVTGHWGGLLVYGAHYFG